MSESESESVKVVGRGKWKCESGRKGEGVEMFWD